MKAMIDRIEDGFAVLELEDRTMESVLLSLIQGTVEEGACLFSEDGINWIQDEEAERENSPRQARIKDLMAQLFK